MDWLERLNQIKKISGKTNEEIAYMSGVPKSTVDKIFSGQTKNPSYTTVQLIVNCLGYPVDAISQPYENPMPEIEKASLELSRDAMINDIANYFAQLSPEERKSALDYAEFLIYRRNSKTSIIPSTLDL